MKLVEIDRRGFLRGVGMATGSAVSGQEIKAVLNVFAKDVGGTKNVMILYRLLHEIDAIDLEGIATVFRGENTIEAGLNDDERISLQDEIWDRVYYQNEEHGSNISYNDMKNALLRGVNGKNDINNTIDRIAELIGQETNIKKVRDILGKYNVAPKIFFDKASGYGELIKKAAKDAFNKKYPRSSESVITPDNIVDLAKQAALPAKDVRLATAISSLAKKVWEKIKQIPPTPEPTISSTDSTPKDKPLALPAPSDKDEIVGWGNIERMKDLAGIRQDKRS